MREKLNDNPLAQLAVVGVLLVFAGIFVMSSMGGGGEEEADTATVTESATVTTPTAEATVTATVTATEMGEALPSSPAAVPEIPAPPLPPRLVAAFEANRTVVLLIVKRGGIDDAVTAAGALPLAFKRDVALFVVPARRIARYTAITQGVDVNRVPALVVLRPRSLAGGTVNASVSYGFQSPQSIVQAVVDARYDGRTLPYHP
ncbi:MAG: hypothetical protein WBL45_12615 [Solirubrobacterales bacterium]